MIGLDQKKGDDRMYVYIIEDNHRDRMCEIVGDTIVLEWENVEDARRVLREALHAESYSISKVWKG